MRFCPVAGCSEIVRAGRCDQHAIRRPSGTAWYRLQAQVLARDVFCRSCGTAPATEVDHDPPLALGGHPTDPAACVGLCGPCHRRRTLEDRRER